MSTALDEAGWVISRMEHGKNSEGYRGVAAAVVREWLEVRLDELCVKGSGGRIVVGNDSVWAPTLYDLLLSGDTEKTI